MFPIGISRCRLPAGGVPQTVIRKWRLGDLRQVLRGLVALRQTRGASASIAPTHTPYILWIPSLWVFSEERISIRPSSHRPAAFAPRGGFRQGAPLEGKCKQSLAHRRRAGQGCQPVAFGGFCQTLFRGFHCHGVLRRLVAGRLVTRSRVCHSPHLRRKNPRDTCRHGAGSLADGTGPPEEDNGAKNSKLVCLRWSLSNPHDRGGGTPACLHH